MGYHDHTPFGMPLDERPVVTEGTVQNGTSGKKSIAPHWYESDEGRVAIPRAGQERKRMVRP